MKAVRTLSALASGCLLMTGVLKLLGPPQDVPGLNFLILGVSVIVAVAMAAGFLTAWVAGYREIPHASGLGLTMIAIAALSMWQRGISRPGWFETAIAGCGPIAAMIGAAIRLLTKRRIPTTSN